MKVICNCAGWLVAVFSLASSETAVVGAVVASRTMPLFNAGVFIQPWTSLVMSRPTHWLGAVIGTLPRLDPGTGALFQLILPSCQVLVASYTSMEPAVVTRLTQSQSTAF